MNYIFDASDPSMMMVRTENLYAKETSKFQILSYKIVTYLKRKLRACTMRIYQEKMKISANKKFFKYFSIFSTYSRPPKNFIVQFAINFEKETSKMAFLGQVK